METILNGIQNSISVISPDMEIVEVNAELLKQMDCSREEVIGKKCYEVFNLKDPENECSGLLTLKTREVTLK